MSEITERVDRELASEKEKFEESRADVIQHLSHHSTGETRLELAWTLRHRADLIEREYRIDEEDSRRLESMKSVSASGHDPLQMRFRRYREED